MHPERSLAHPTNVGETNSINLSYREPQILDVEDADKLIRSESSASGEDSPMNGVTEDEYKLENEEMQIRAKPTIRRIIMLSQAKYRDLRET